MQLTTDCVWRDIVGYEGSYQVSNTGLVRSLDRFVHYLNHGSPAKMFCKGRILKQDVDEDGYCRINIGMNGKGKRYGVHRLVAEAFIPNLDGKPTVNHKDGNKQNNCVENLEWATVLEQNLHAISFGLREGTMSEARVVAKKSISRPVRCIETGQVFESQLDAERKLGLGSTAVYHSIKFHRPTKQGYTFELVNH